MQRESGGIYRKELVFSKTRIPGKVTNLLSVERIKAIYEELAKKVLVILQLVLEMLNLFE